MFTAAKRKTPSRVPYTPVVVLLALITLLPAPPSLLGVHAVGPGDSALESRALDPRFTSITETVEQSGAVPLDLFIETQMVRAHLPGLSAAIVKHGEVVWTGAYGYSRLRSKEPVTEDTLFELGSVSKTFIATAVMQSVERGLLDLDADINQYLSFEVTNPQFPDMPITTRMLTAHTSSIIDNYDVFQRAYRPGDPRIPLGEFLADFLSRGGKYYDAEQNYAQVAPGTAWSYSNFGSSLAAYLVEVVNGVPFYEYCTTHIFEPLGMSGSGFRFADVHISNMAMPYGYVETTGGYRPYGFYGCPIYPAGWAISSAPQLARHLIAFMQYGEYNGVRVLDPESVEEMRSEQYPDVESSLRFGVFWYYKDLMDRELLGHAGGNDGVIAEMFFRTEDDVGVVLLMNGDWTESNEQTIYSIEQRLFRESAKY